MSYAVIRRQIGADLWETLSTGFQSATTAVKSTASAAWEEVRSAADATYQADLEKQAKCQQRKPIAGLGEPYYDKEAKMCVDADLSEQKASCEASGGAWVTSLKKDPESGAMVIRGCVAKDVANAYAEGRKGKTECLEGQKYDYNYAVGVCKAPGGPKAKAECAKSTGTPIWTVWKGSRKGGFWYCFGEQLAPKKPASQSGFGATSQGPKTWTFPRDAQLTYPPISSIDDSLPSRRLSDDDEEQSPRGWQSLSTAQKVGIVGGGAVVALTAIYLIVR